MHLIVLVWWLCVLFARSDRSPLPCNNSACMYGAGYGSWSQAAQLADGSYVACTAAVWLCGHFGVPAEVAGIHAWHSENSYDWTWIGRPASLTLLPGYPEWFGPGEGPNEHDLVLLADQKTLMVVFRIDGNGECINCSLLINLYYLGSINAALCDAYPAGDTYLPTYLARG